LELETKVNAEDVIRKALDVYNRHDVNAYIAILDPDYLAYEPLSPEPLKGRETLRKVNEDLLKAFPDFEFRILNIMTKGGLVAAECVMSGTFKGLFEFAGRTIPPTGRRFETRIVWLVRVNSKGLLAEGRNYYYDQAGFYKQLGMKA